MNFYPFHLGDYSSHTRHLSLLEDLAYRRMLDLYYTLEKPLPLDPEKVARLIGMRDQIREVSDVLSDFFVKSEEGHRNLRCDKEIETYKAKAERAKLANKSRWNANKSESLLKSDVISDMKSESVQIPTITNNQEPIYIKTNGDKSPEFSDSFLEAWELYPKRPGNSKKDSYKQWKARLKAGCTEAEMIEGVRKYAAYVVAMKTEAQYIKQAQTFFGVGEHFKTLWSSPKQETVVADDPYSRMLRGLSNAGN